MLEIFKDLFISIFLLWVSLSMLLSLFCDIARTRRRIPLWALLGSTVGTLIGVGLLFAWIIRDIFGGSTHV